MKISVVFRSALFRSEVFGKGFSISFVSLPSFSFVTGFGSDFWVGSRRASLALSNTEFYVGAHHFSEKTDTKPASLIPFRSSDRVAKRIQKMRLFCWVLKGPNTKDDEETKQKRLAFSGDRISWWAFPNGLLEIGNQKGGEGKKEWKRFGKLSAPISDRWRNEASTWIWNDRLEREWLFLSVGDTSLLGQSRWNFKKTPFQSRKQPIKRQQNPITCNKTLFNAVKNSKTK